MGVHMQIKTWHQKMDYFSFLLFTTTTKTKRIDYFKVSRGRILFQQNQENNYDINHFTQKNFTALTLQNENNL